MLKKRKKKEKNIEKIYLCRKRKNTINYNSDIGGIMNQFKKKVKFFIIIEPRQKYFLASSKINDLY